MKLKALYSTGLLAQTLRDGPLMIWGGASGREFVLSFFPGRVALVAFARAPPQIINGSSLIVLRGLVEPESVSFWTQYKSR